MPTYLDTTGESTLGIGICDRCSRKMPLSRLHPDPNSPGLKVCDEDTDQYDPYRLPARQPEPLTLPFYRPDLPLTFDSDDTVREIRITEVDEEIRVTESEDIRILEE